MTRDEKTAVLGVSAIAAIGCCLWLVAQSITDNPARRVAEPPTASRPCQPATAQAGRGSQAAPRSSSRAEGGAS